MDIREICNHFGATLEEVIGTSRKLRIAKCRCLVAYVLRTDYSYSKLAYLLNRKDHTAAINWVTRAQNLIDTDDEVKKIYGEFIEKLELIAKES